MKVPVVQSIKKGIPEYQGKMKARDLVRLWDIERFREEDLEGYQREQYDERLSDVAEYIQNCPIPLMPAIYVGIKNGMTFSPIPEADGLGYLDFGDEKGVIKVIDGQHRGGGFDYIRRKVLPELQEEHSRGQVTDEELEAVEATLDYDVNVTFVDTVRAAEEGKKSVEDPDVTLGPEDVERTLFIIINKTQKSIRPSLNDTLMYKIRSAGIPGIPIIERDQWRTEATQIGIRLNRNGPPLAGQINISGRRGMAMPVQLASFVSSLESLMKNDPFTALASDEQYQYVKNYWTVLRDSWPNAFNYPRDHFVLRTIGVYTLNRLANDVFGWCREKGLHVPSVGDIQPYLSPLAAFNWRRQDSQVRAYGGQAGVAAAHTLLLENLKNGGVAEAGETLRVQEENRTRREDRRSARALS